MYGGYSKYFQLVFSGGDVYLYKSDGFKPFKVGTEIRILLNSDKVLQEDKDFIIMNLDTFSDLTDGADLRFKQMFIEKNSLFIGREFHM